MLPLKKSHCVLLSTAFLLLSLSMFASAQEIENHSTLTIVSSTSGSVQENEFLVLRSHGETVYWTAIGPNGEEIAKGQANNKAKVYLEKVFDNVYAFQRSQKQNEPNKPKYCYFSLLLISNQTVKVCRLSNTEQEKMFVQDAGLGAAFQQIRSKVHNKRYNLPHLLWTGSAYDMPGDVTTPEAAKKFSEKKPISSLPPRNPNKMVPGPTKQYPSSQYPTPE